MPQVAQFRTIPGVGILTATAVEAFVGPLNRFPSGRHFASYLGLTPRERSSGLTRNLGPITKKGDKYIRMLLIHGARTVLWHAKKKAQPDHLRTWALALEQHRGHNIAAVRFGQPHRPHPLGDIRQEGGLSNEANRELIPSTQEAASRTPSEDGVPV